MPIKQLQLRGITREPSDRMIADGGCAESLNVQMDKNELAPVIPPKSVRINNQDYDASRKIIFIHKIPQYTNYLAYIESSHSLSFLIENGTWSTPYAIGSATEEIISVSAIGNTVVVLTDATRYFFLFKGGGYVNLGTQIPRIDCEFITTSQGSTTIVYDKIDDVFNEGREQGELTDIFVLMSLDAAQYNTTASYYGTTSKRSVLFNGSTHEFENVTTVFNNVANTVWAKLNNQAVVDRANDIFCKPVLARYALKMYDGSYIYQSVPILLGAGLANHFCTVKTSNATSDPNERKITITGNSRFKVKMSVKGAASLGDWKDIIQSIDVFISEDVAIDKNGSILSVASGSGDEKTYSFKGDVKLEDDITNKGNFYKVKSYDFNESIADEYIKPKSQDDLLVQQKLDFDYRSSNNPSPLNGMIAYNNRILGFGERETLTSGFPFLQSALYSIVPGQAAPISDTHPYIKFKWWIRTKGGAEYCIYGRHRDHAGATTVTDYESGYSDSGATAGTYDLTTITPYGLLMYPDSRCFKVEIIYNDGTDTTYYSVPMKEHPNLDCAYFFCGDLTTTLKNSIASYVVQTAPSATENKDVKEPNQLILSLVDNPFIIPTTGWMAFASDVYYAATTTRPISQGQFGQFPIYVFTRDGINAVAINADGSFNSQSPVSRDVAIEGTIIPIEQSVIFATKKGLMMLSGVDTVNLADCMLGHHYVIENDARVLLQATQWREYDSILADSTPFMEFVSQSRICYDYAGQRLLCFKENKTYAYVYRFESKSWHKVSLPSGMRFVSLLNSYPDALVTMQGANGYTVMNFSTVLDNSAVTEDTNTFIKGVVVSRPFDLGATDIRKTINEMRLRGYYDRNHVKYLILGSMDGINYAVKTSLRGHSFKSYRLILLLEINPTERLSWVDIDFDVRLTDKLR